MGYEDFHNKNKLLAYTPIITIPCPETFTWHVYFNRYDGKSKYHD